MLLSLASPSQKAAETMKQYNIQAYDAQATSSASPNLAGQLQTNLSGVSQAQRDSALSIIFGSDAIRTANVLYKEGSKGIRGWIDSVNDTGFAAEQANGKMDNLNGDLSKLGAAFDTALIKTGSGANGILRDIVQNLTSAAAAVGELPEPVLATGLALTGLVAVIGLVGGGALVAVPKIVQFKNALETLTETGPKAAAGVSAAGSAVRALPYVAVLLWLAQLSTGFITTARQALGLEQSVSSMTKTLTESTKLSKKTIDQQLNATIVGFKSDINGLSQLTTVAG